MATHNLSIMRVCHSLTQTVNVPTRQDKILDLFLTNYSSIVNNLETLPPIGESDHDIVLSECVTSLRRCQSTPRKIQQFSKASWDKINEGLSKLHNKILQEKDSCSIEDLLNDFKLLFLKLFQKIYLRSSLNRQHFHG